MKEVFVVTINRVGMSEVCKAYTDKNAAFDYVSKVEQIYDRNSDYYRSLKSEYEGIISKYSEELSNLQDDLSADEEIYEIPNPEHRDKNFFNDLEPLIPASDIDRNSPVLSKKNYFILSKSSDPELMQAFIREYCNGSYLISSEVKRIKIE